MPDLTRAEVEALRPFAPAPSTNMGLTCDGFPLCHACVTTAQQVADLVAAEAAAAAQQVTP
jgi:hypothetical protein